MNRNFLNSMESMESLKYDWSKWARPSQTLPPGDWRVWLVKAGRGFGKTRTGAEAVRVWVRSYSRVNIIAPTFDDCRDICIEGESGILAITPRSERPNFIPSRHLLQWPNGATSLLFSADEPDRLRGKQHEKLWCEELAAWRNPEAWDQAMFGLRLGANPQAVVTTTPRPSAIIKALVKDPHTIVTHGTSYENRVNLAPAFLDKIITRYEGTRLGRQELLAEILSDREGALFRQADIDASRVESAPDLVRVVVSVDPATTSHAQSDETGIIVAGRDNRKPAHFYVLDDLSCTVKPEQWARRAVAAYRRHQADRVVAETNMGGDLVESVIRTVDADVSYRGVRASRGKAIRAEPISSLYQQGRVHHVGIFGELEDQMTDFVPGASASPDRMDGLVWALTDLSEQGGSFMSGWVGQAIEAFKAAKAEHPGMAPEEVALRCGLVPGAPPYSLADAQMAEQSKRAGEPVFKKDRGTFGALKSLSMPTSRVSEPRTSQGPDCCPQCGNKGLARYNGWQRCACGWDSRAEIKAAPRLGF